MRSLHSFKRLLVLLPLLGGMAWGQTLDVTSDSGNQGAVSTYSWTHTTGAGLSNSVILVAVQIPDDNGNNIVVSSVSYNGSSLALVSDGTNNAKATLSGGAADAEIWCLASPTAGAHSVQVTISHSPIRKSRAAAATVSNTSCTARNVTLATNAGAASSALTVSSNTNDFVIDSIASLFDTGSEAYSAGPTVIYASASSSTFVGSAYLVPASGSTTFTVTFGGTEGYAHVGAAFKASGSSSPTCQPTLSTLGVSQCG